MIGKVLAQNGDQRFMIDAGEDDGLRVVRVYDMLLQTLGEPVLEGSLRAFDPGWVPPTASPNVITVIEEKVAKPY